MLEDLLKQLATLQQTQEEMKDVLETQMSLIEDTKLWQEYQEQKDFAKNIDLEIADLKERVKEYAVEAYKATGEKKIASGVGVRVYQQVDYDEDVAFEFCLTHLHPVLKLDKSKLERHLKAIKETAPPEWAVYYEEPKGTVSNDLSDWR